MLQEMWKCKEKGTCGKGTMESLQEKDSAGKKEEIWKKYNQRVEREHQERLDVNWCSAKE